MEKRKNLIKEHLDLIVTVISIMVAFFWGMFWIDGKFEVVNQRFTQIDQRFSQLEREVTQIKTVLILKNIMPIELCKKEEIPEHKGNSK